MKSAEKTFLKNIYRFGRKERFFNMLGNLTLLCLLLLLLWVSVTLADTLFYFSDITRWGLLLINIVILAFLLNRFLLRPLSYFLRFKEHADLSAVAARIATFYPKAADGFINIYQLIINKEATGISTALRNAAIESFLQKYGKDDYSVSLQLKYYLPSLKFALPLFAGALFILGFYSNNIIHSTLRLINPANEYLVVPGYLFTVQPGNIKIFKGDTINFKIGYQGPALKSCFLQKLPQRRGISPTSVELYVKNGFYTLQLKDIRRSFVYYIEGKPLNNISLEGHIYSKRFRIIMQTPPAVKNLDIILTPPSYTNLQAQRLQRNVGDFSALPGSKVKIKLTVTKEVSNAFLSFSGGKKLPLPVSGQRIGGEFTVFRAQKYKIIFQDTSGLFNRDPIDYQISLLKDEAPFVEITKPGEDMEGRPDVRIPINITADDDYGLSALFLHYQILSADTLAIKDTSWKRIPVALRFKPNLHKESTFLWNFDDLPLAFGNELRYYASARDNNSISGPGIGKSRVYSVRFPSLEEVFNNFDKQQDKEQNKLKDVARQAREMKKTLEKIDREMKRAKKIDWEKNQQMSKAMKQQQELQKKVAKIRKNLNEMLEKLENKQLISDQVLEKYGKLQELLQQVMTPELQQALSKLQKAMDRADANQVRRALQEFRLQQEAFEKSIERAMELLKQVRFEQKMDELVKKAENLARQQGKMNRRLKKRSPDKKDFEQLKKEQQQQKSLLKRFEKDLKNFRQETLLTKFPKTKSTLDSLSQAEQKAGLDKKIQALGRQLAAQQKQMAQNNSRQLQQQFSEIKKALNRARGKMLQQGKQQVMQQMARAAGKMLQLSFKQEGLHRRARAASPLSDDFGKVSREQGQILNDFHKVISQIIKLSKETFALDPQLNKSLRTAGKSMQQSLADLAERNKMAAMRMQGKAMGALNRGVMQMQQSMSNLEQAQSGTGFEQFMKQLQQMAGSQGQINDQSLNIFQMQGNKGKLNSQQQQAMKRLAARQAALQQAMQQLNKKMGQRKDLLGNLGQMAKQMDKVVKDLLKQNISRKTIERQRQILSRMLEAQKSLEQRKYSKKREAIRAREYMAKDPGHLGTTINADKKLIQQALLRALKAGYKKDYRQLIEAYFKKLLQEK